MTPEYIKQKIRGRLGLEEDDTSQDEVIANMTPKEKLRAVLGWELGDAAWADQFIMWAENCGYEIKETDDS